MGKVSESIFSGVRCIVPMAEVQHIEKLKRGPYASRGESGPQPNGLHVITRMTKWSMERQDWDNPIYIEQEEADAFIRAWCTYRSELESETLADLRPDATEITSAT